MKFGLTPYVATIDSGPSGIAVVVNTATPDAFNVAVPSTVAPSVNVTVPSGEPTTGVNAVTVAVSAIQRAQPAFTPEPLPTSPMTPAEASASELGLPPTSRRALPGTGTAPRPAPNVGDPSEVIISNNFPGPVRVFGLAPGSENEQLVRSMKPGEEAMVPTVVGQTLIIRATIGGREVQRHKVGKKLEVLKLGAPQQQ